ncbi:MAG TPA: hypothetical protein VG454_17575 [Gemmatimonadales bacterium]|nr:hypothetical protein [Gemmatimonadales bacterium]
MSLKPRIVQPGLGPVVISLAAGAMTLLAGVLVNGCRISKLLSASSEANGPLVVNPTVVHDSALVGSTTARIAHLDVLYGRGWSVATDQSWIQLNPASGSAHGDVRVLLQPKNLSPGMHAGAVTVAEKTAAAGDGSTVTVDISFLILQPILSVAPGSLTYTAHTDNSVFNDTLRVANKGNGPLTWTARIAQHSNWITLAATAGDGPGNIPVRVSNAGLSYWATYRDTIIVDAPGAKDSPARIPVLLKRKH